MMTSWSFHVAQQPTKMNYKCLHHKIYGPGRWKIIIAVWFIYVSSLFVTGSGSRLVIAIAISISNTKFHVISCNHLPTMLKPHEVQAVAFVHFRTFRKWISFSFAGGFPIFYENKSIFSFFQGKWNNFLTFPRSSKQIWWRIWACVVSWTLLIIINRLHPLNSTLYTMATGSVSYLHCEIRWRRFCFIVVWIRVAFTLRQMTRIRNSPETPTD